MRGLDEACAEQGHADRERYTARRARAQAAQLTAHRSEGKAKHQAIAQLQAQNNVAMLMLGEDPLSLARWIGRDHRCRKATYRAGHDRSAWRH